MLNGATLTDLRAATSLAASLAERCLLVAVDGGLGTCRRGDRRPDLFVGDGDSAGPLPRGLPAVRLPRDKDCSDLGAALDEIRRRRVRVVVVAGLLGGRLDHEWANLFELASRAGDFAGLLAPTRRGTVIVTTTGCRMATERGRTVSLFAMGGSALVSLAGTRWELRRSRLHAGSRGLSNVAGTELDLTVHEGVVTLVSIPRASTAS